MPARKKAQPPTKARPKNQPRRTPGKKSAKQNSADGSQFQIVGVGASAGGLEAFTQFLGALPLDTGLGFIFIQHLDPTHESMSAEILSRVTRMPVTEAKDGMVVSANCVYTIPPNHRLEISHRTLKLSPRMDGPGPQMVIDNFFSSLATDQKELAIGAIFSGSNADGTAGLRSIKAHGGITFAQSPESAKFNFMPQSAISSGVVDLVLTPAHIAGEITRISRHPYAISKIPKLSEVEKESPPRSLDALAEILLLLKSTCHVDFTLYKYNTIHRRISRRMVLQKIESLDAYAAYLALHPAEVKALFADILIHVTRFFRNPEAFRKIQTDIFPKLIQNRKEPFPIRIWVPGCSSGEEVYSLAILLSESLAREKLRIPFQIFATDISDSAIQKARKGEYSAEDVSELTAERIRKYFVLTEWGGYKVNKDIRDCCLFSRHDVTTDPPFARLDLISCRNLLIYFGVNLQKHIIPIFHYALKPNGVLWLGNSETISGFSRLFSEFDKTHKIFTRKNAPVSIRLNFPASTYVYGKEKEFDSKFKIAGFAKHPFDAQKVGDLAFQSKYPSVLISENMEVLQIRGRVSPFLEPASGLASHQLLKMAQSGIVAPLRMAIQLAKKKNQPVKKLGLTYKEGRRTKSFNLVVIPAPQENKERFFLILFEEVSKSAGLPKAALSSRIRLSVNETRQSKDLALLQRELTSTQEHQLELVEKYEGTQQDLSTLNEELQSTNEELQSTNEELETAKEELQSGNEELTTVNEELQIRSLEQTQSNNDLINLLASVEIPIVMLSQDHRIRRFTPLAGKALNLIPSDVGRPIGDLKLNFSAPGMKLDLDELVQEVIDHLTPKEVEVQNLEGRWFRLHARPYQTVDNRIDGTVIALVDIHSLKLARNEADMANRSKDLFLATLSHELRTPLTAILSWAEMLKRGKLDPEKQMRGIDTILECGKAQAQLINDLLDVSRVVAGKVSFELTELNPAQSILAAIESVRSSAEKKAITIETHFSPHVGRVLADSTRLQQIIWNLLSNAIKFSGPQSKVHIHLEKVEGKGGGKARAEIKVVDSGKGIRPDFLPKLFETFSQEDRSSVRVHGGLGLGLAIVKNLVEMQGGVIQAESAGEGLGSTFTVLFPISSYANFSGGDSIAISPEHAPNEDPLQLKGVKILIVDDERNSRDAFAEILGSYGAEVSTAGSTGEALLVFSKFKPHILVSDIAMPGEDGHSLMRKIRALPEVQGGNVPSLAVTAFAGVEDVQRALDAGFNVHLAKPVNGQQFARVLGHLFKPKLTRNQSF